MKEAFEELKQRFQKEVILRFPDLSKEWWITVDSSTYAFGGTLEQEDDNGNLRPVAFFSKTLPGTRTKRPDGSYPKAGQLNWHILDQEMYGIVATLYKFRSWLQTGVKIKCRMDHKSLESWVKEDFDRMGGPVGRQSRWHQFLATFFLEVVYIKGEDNGAADVPVGGPISLIWPNLTPTCMGAMPTKRVGRNQSGKLHNGLAQNSQS